MKLAIVFLLCLIGMAVPAGSFAQPATTAPPPPAISADQARAALDVLNDPAKRAAFTATLNAIVKTQPQAAAPDSAPAVASTGTLPGPSPGTPPRTPTTASAKPATNATTVGGVSIPLAPDSLGAQVLLSASSLVGHIGKEAMDAMETAQSLPLLYGWAVVMVTNPIALDILADVSWRVALTLAVAGAVGYGLHQALRKPIRGLERLAPGHRHATGDLAPDNPENDDETTRTGTGDDATRTGPGDDATRAGTGDTEAPHWPPPSAWNVLSRVPIVLARLVLELVPVLGIALIGHLIAGSFIGGQTISRLIILAVVEAFALCIALLSLARMLLSPSEPRLRLFHLSDKTAAYMMRWSRRLILVAVCGYAVGEAGLLLGMSDIAHDAFEKCIGLMIHISLAIIVIQKRRAVGRWFEAPPGSTGIVAAIRNRLGQIWYVIALFVLIGGWLVWAVEVPHGFSAFMHYFIVTALVMIGARLMLLLLLGAIDRIMRPGALLNEGMQSRLKIYHPAVSIAVRIFIYFLSVVGLLQLYGLNTFLWLVESALGVRIISATGTLVTTIVLAFAAWEAINGGVQQHLDRLQREAQLAKSARLRTLLPLLRSTLLITITIVAGLMILSEIGINIAPLLAGAGIVGVAIGFGSQKLVQDLITGIFLLVENAMQVGDWVTVSGLSGTVENLSVRTIRLRDGDGSVHIIPFSSVTSVTNVNRGLGNAAVSVSVAYAEDTDRVAEELTAIIADMRNDPALSAMMLSDFQLWGVDKVDGSAVTITGQVVCTDAGRWPVQREFNRRMKRRFQELGIKIFNPVPTISVTVPVQAPVEKGPPIEKGPQVEKGDIRGHARAAN